MGILLAFAPFIAFAVAAQFIGVTSGLVAGAGVAASLLLRGWLAARKPPKVLEAGAMLLFGGLACYSVLFTPAWPFLLVRLFIDGGLFVIVLASLATRLPFTLQYAREQVPREFWARPEFVRANYVITVAWGLAFAVMVGADVAMLYLPTLPSWVGVAATVMAIAGAIAFTGRYPAHIRAKAEAVARISAAAPGL